jgi:hypothetical protein
MIPCYWGVAELKIADCKDCYAKLVCKLAEGDEELKKNVKPTS